MLVVNRDPKFMEIVNPQHVGYHDSWSLRSLRSLRLQYRALEHSSHKAIPHHIPRCCPIILRWQSIEKHVRFCRSNPCILFQQQHSSVALLKLRWININQIHIWALVTLRRTPNWSVNDSNSVDPSKYHWCWSIPIFAHMISHVTWWNNKSRTWPVWHAEQLENMFLVVPYIEIV